MYIDALEDTEVHVFAKDTSREQSNVEPLLKRIAVLQERVIMLLGANALERYQHFLDTYPDITQRVPQRMIASYLGVAPEALSKLKGDRLKAERSTRKPS